MSRLSYYLLEQNTNPDIQSSLETREQTKDLEVFFTKVKQQQDNYTNVRDQKRLAQYFKLLPQQMLTSYTNALSDKGYFTGSNKPLEEEVRKALLIEYIKNQTKIVDRNNDAFERVWMKYEKNSQSWTTKNERRFLQVYLFINGHFPIDKNIFDECDSIIGIDTKAAYEQYKKSLKWNNNSSPSVIANTTPTPTAPPEKTTSQEPIDMVTFDPLSFDQTNKDSIRAFQTWFNTNVLQSNPLKALKVDGTFWSKTRLAFKQCWEEGRKIGWYKQTPLFADPGITDKLFQEVFSSGAWYQLIKKLTSSWDTPTALARILALAKHEGKLKFGRKNLDPSHKWYSFGTFQLHTPWTLTDAENNYNKLLNRGIKIARREGIDTNSLTIQDKDLLARVGHVEDKSTIKKINLRKPLADNSLNQDQLVDLVSNKIQVGLTQIGINVANWTLPPSEITTVSNDSVDGSFVYNYIA